MRLIGLAIASSPPAHQINYTPERQAGKIKGPVRAFGIDA
jgi:hypothetical protein